MSKNGVDEAEYWYLTFNNKRLHLEEQVARVLYRVLKGETSCIVSDDMLDAMYVDYEEYIKNIDWDLLITELRPSNIHGDLQFDNVIISESSEFKVIDWRHEFGSIVEYGDIYYDLAKLYGGFIIDYSKIKTNNFTINLEGTRVYLDIPNIANHTYYIQTLLEYIRNSG